MTTPKAPARPAAPLTNRMVAPLGNIALIARAAEALGWPAITWRDGEVTEGRADWRRLLDLAATDRTIRALLWFRVQNPGGGDFDPPEAA